MKRNKHIYLKKNILLISFLFLFFSLFFNFSLVSATATFSNALTEVHMPFNDEAEIDINSYCNDCSYFWITFRNPDNLVNIVSVKSSNPITYSNSYFNFKLNSDGVMEFESKVKEVDTQFSVYASNNPTTPQTFHYFYLKIRENLKPIQTKAFPSVINIVGNSSYSAPISAFFETGSPNGLTEALIELKQGGSSIVLSSVAPACNNSTFSMKVCITSDGIFSLKGTNQSANFTLKVTGRNENGDTSAPIIQVNGFITGGYTSVPVRTNFNFGNLSLAFNETKGVIMDGDTFYWRNFTYISAKVINTSSGSNVTLNSSLENVGNLSASFDEYTIFVTWNGVFIKSKNENINFPVWVSACNAVGCDNTNSVLNVNILGDVPTPVGATPLNPIGTLPDFITIVLDYNQYKAIDMNDYFDDLNYTMVNWSDGVDITNGTLRTPTTQAINNSIGSFSSNGFPAYQISVTFGNIIEFTSGSNDTNFILNVTACNSEGCSPYNLIIYFYIATGDEAEVVSQVNSTAWSNIAQTFGSLYPSSEEIDTKQKAGIVLISFFVVSLLFLFFLKNVDIESSTKFYSILTINSILFMFFLAKGYINVIVVSTLSALLLLIIFLKSRGGNIQNG